jgi:predicted alpha/beta-fold hydrolase
MQNHYKPSPLLWNGHLETIYPSLFRNVVVSKATRHHISTPDNDFLEFDLYQNQSKTLVIISHGLEGDAQRAYVLGMVRAAMLANMDALAWYYRGCGPTLNKTLRLYHSGATDDLHTVVQHANTLGYENIYLIGFSLGGNLTLKYLGELNKNASTLNIKKGVAISAPVHLHSACIAISQPTNWIYSTRFLKSLKKKILIKAKQFPSLSTHPIAQIKTLIDFDDVYTAPLHGFKNALDYYTQNSSLYFLDKISVPILILNAKNDPFLSDLCFPNKEVENHPYVQLLVPERGGHVGFSQFNKNGIYWSEERAINFLLP